MSKQSQNWWKKSPKKDNISNERQVFPRSEDSNTIFHPGIYVQ